MLLEVGDVRFGVDLRTVFFFQSGLGVWDLVRMKVALIFEVRLSHQALSSNFQTIFNHLLFLLYFWFQPIA